MADPFVAEIRMFPFNFAPTGWAWCDGQLLPLSQNTALFSLLGTYYGGNGKSNFSLPNLQGCAPMFYGHGPGLSMRYLGENEGSETVTLLQSEMPPHKHAVDVNAAQATVNSGQDAWIASTGRPGYTTSGGNKTLSASTLTNAGGNAPHNNMMPYLTVYFCIALQGVFPPRS